MNVSLFSHLSYLYLLASRLALESAWKISDEFMMLHASLKYGFCAD